MCIQTGKTLEDDARMRMETRQLYVKSETEMRTLFASCPDAVDNTTKIAERCQVEFEFGVTRLPHYPVPKDETPQSNAAIACAWKGMGPPVSRSEGGRTSPYKRLHYELDTIAHMGYVDYFLIVWDFIHYAKIQRHHGRPGARQRRRLHRCLFAWASPCWIL